MQASEILATIYSQNPQPIMHQSANFGVHTHQFKKVFELLEDFTNEIEHKSREVLYQICGTSHLSQDLLAQGTCQQVASLERSRVATSRIGLEELIEGQKNLHLDTCSDSAVKDPAGYQ